MKKPKDVEASFIDKKHVLRAIPLVVWVLIGTFFVAAACEEWTPALMDPENSDGPLAPQFAKSHGPTGPVLSPVRIALARHGWLLVSDPQRGGVFRVDPATMQPDQFLDVGGRALSVGVMSKTVLVGNETDHTVDAYNNKGQYQFSFTTPVGRPLDIAVDERAGLVFVVDADASEVKVFDADGILVTTIGGAGSAEPLRLATGIAVDPVHQEVLVAEYAENGENASIKIFDYQGVLLAEVSPGSCGWFGGCSGGFSRPQGVAVDDQGHIYVVDAFLAQILIYDRTTLEQVGALGGKDAGPPNLRIPLDLVVSSIGDVYVTSNQTKSVEVFRNGVAVR